MFRASGCRGLLGCRRPQRRPPAVDSTSDERSSRIVRRLGRLGVVFFFFFFFLGGGGGGLGAFWFMSFLLGGFLGVSFCLCWGGWGFSGAGLLWGLGDDLFLGVSGLRGLGVYRGPRA